MKICHRNKSEGGGNGSSADGEPAAYLHSRCSSYSAVQLTKTTRNNGELAEGWYDPATKLKASSSLSADPTASHAGDDHDEQDRPRKRRPSPDYDPTTAGYAKVDRDSASSSSDDDALGPSLPAPNQARPPGPAIPSLDDLALRADDAGAAQADVLADLSHARRLDRAAQRAALDELAPRADPGTRERRLEKRAAVAEKLRGYRERSPVAEVDEGELMGGAGDGREQLRRDRDRWERRKSEREIRKEEVLRVSWGILCLSLVLLTSLVWLEEGMMGPRGF